MTDSRLCLEEEHSNDLENALIRLEEEQQRCGGLGKDSWGPSSGLNSWGPRWRGCSRLDSPELDFGASAVPSEGCNPVTS